jgi:hypothetical protein
MRMRCWRGWRGIMRFFSEDGFILQVDIIVSTYVKDHSFVYAALYHRAVSHKGAKSQRSHEVCVSLVVVMLNKLIFNQTVL